MPLLDQPAVQVGSVRIEADSNQPTVAAAFLSLAAHDLGADSHLERFGGGLPATVALAMAGLAGLPRLGCVDTYQPDSLPQLYEVEGIAVDDPWMSGYGFGLSRRTERQSQGYERRDHHWVPLFLEAVSEETTDPCRLPSKARSRPIP